MTVPLVDRRFRFASLIVTVTSGLVASLFGLLAAIGYCFNERATPGFEVLGPVGFALGASSGAAVGLAWSKWMAKKALAYLGAGRAPIAPVLGLASSGGALAGILSTVFLHAGLFVLRPGLSLIDANVIWSIGMLLGMPSGLLVGFLGGIGWLVVMRRALRTPTP